MKFPVANKSFLCCLFVCLIYIFVFLLVVWNENENCKSQISSSSSCWSKSTDFWINENFLFRFQVWFDYIQKILTFKKKIKSFIDCVSGYVHRIIKKPAKIFFVFEKQEKKKKNRESLLHFSFNFDSISTFWLINFSKIHFTVEGRKRIQKTVEESDEWMNFTSISSLKIK